MQHTGQKHGGQTLLEDSVGHLRWLNRRACVHCGTIRSQRLSPLQLLRVRHSSPRTSRWGHLPGQTTARASGRSGTAVRQVSNSLRARCQYLQENLWTTARFRTVPIRDVVLTERNKQLLTELRRGIGDGTPALRGLSLRHWLGQKVLKEP